MTISTLIGIVEVNNQHTCTGNRAIVQVEGNLAGSRIDIKQRQNLPDESGFDDPDGRNIRGTGVRDIAVTPGMIIYPNFNGGRNGNANISVEITDA